MKEKVKPGAVSWSSLKFVLMWMGGHGGIWVAGMVGLMSLSTLRIYFYDMLTPMMLGALSTGVLSALWQKWMVERGLNKSMRGWLPVSTAGWALSGLAMYFFVALLLPAMQLRETDFVARLALMPLFLPVAIVQWIWLRKRVENAWLWVMAALVGAIVFILPLMPVFYSRMVAFMPIPEFVQYFTVGLAALLYSGATGATMRYLWTQQRDKSKNEALQAGQADEAESARLERLKAAEEAAHEQPPARQQRDDSAEKILTSPGQ